MKLVVRMLALSIVLAGATAASFSSSSAATVSSQAVSAKLPVPLCGPGMPHCPAQNGTSVR